MKNHTVSTSQTKAAKIAGFMFLFSLIVPLLNWSLVLSKFIVVDDIIATAKNILNNELLFRVGISIELIMSIGLIIIASALYSLLKPINKDIALLALLLKIVEGTLMAVTVLIPLIALQIIPGGTSQISASADQLMLPIGLIFNSHTAITSIPMVFLGLDMMLFSYLFFKSKYIPRIISIFGILSFLLILIHALMFIITPHYAVLPINQIIFWFPSGIFEIIIGTWLLTRGIKVE